MKKKITYIFAGIMLVLCFSQCSTKKNTWATRSYHKVTARYNVYFNAKQSYLTGVENIKKANQDNYNEIIRVFETSSADAAKAGVTNMDRTIEKCEKGIKLHSIVKKPKKNPNKAKDPDYKAFMAKEEYNPIVQQCWLLMGIAQYHKCDYMAASATLSYCSRHFSENRDVYTLSRLYLARCYTDLEWYYEAEDVLNKLSEKNFVPKTNKIFVLVKTDLLLQQGQYTEALPYLQQSIKNTKGSEKARMYFIYGQVLEHLGRYSDAYTAYESCIDKTPPAQMEFNAFLNMARCYQGTETSDILKQLARLLKKQSNAQYHDQIYYAMGQLYARNGDMDKAAEYYQKAVESSTRNGVDKAKALLALGEMNMQKRKFREAQPQYSEAVPLLPLDFENYKQISELSNYLNTIAENQNTVILEDSLQALAKLPEADRIKKVQNVIEEEKRKEEEALRQIEEEERQQAIREQNTAMGQTALALGGTADQSWYFYNSTLVTRGKLQFKKSWGSRNLEDNWRRSDKMSGFDFVTEDEGSEEPDEMPTSGALADGGRPAAGETSSDDTEAKLAEYLKMIPLSDEKLANSNSRIETALFNLFVSFENDLKDEQLALETLQELERRFPQSKYLPESYYRLYGMYQRTGSAQAESPKTVLLQRYPDSQYAKIIKYGGATQGETREERIEKLYRNTYEAFTKGDSYAVKQYADQAREMYPDAKLMPKFEFLDIVSHGRQDGPELFRERLSALIEKYPDNEVSPIARDMIALSGQGKEIVQNTSTSANLTQSRTQNLVSRQEFAENIQKAGFVYDPSDQHLFVVLMKGSVQQKNEVLFAIATYNFTSFLIKDFDFELRTLSDGEYGIAVKGLESLDEALWYQNSVLSDGAVQSALSGVEYKAFAISQTNFKAVYDSESANKYLEFYQANNLQIKEADVIKNLREQTGFVGAQQSPVSDDAGK